MNFKSIVFDLDGTISDPSIGYLNGINYALKSLNKEIYNKEDYKDYLGTPLRISFKTHFFKSDSDLVEDAMILFRKYYGEKGKYENVLYDGISELIKNLSSKYDLYILTNKTHPFAIDIVHYFNLSPYFKGVYGIIPNSNDSKADIAKHLNESIFANPNEVLMIGDTIHDITCAKDANWKSCFVSYGFGKKADLTNAMPDKIVETVAELKIYLTCA
jgi:phosphoglycolate phosphatase